jgi:predicted dehydrogenase
MKMIKVALIGAGGMGGVHSEVYKSITNARITAVVDIRCEKAQKLAEAHDASVYVSMDEMLVNEKPDMVDICTPTYLHAGLAVKAMEAGVHVLCEKPVALDLKSAREMKEASTRNKVFFMVAHVIRFWPEYVFLKKLYDEKAYGRLKQASFSRVGGAPLWSWENWIFCNEKSGRVPLDLHIHDADFIMYLFGLPDAVSSYGTEKDNIISYISTRYIYDDMVVDAEGCWYWASLPFSMTFRAFFEKAALEYRDSKLMLYPVDGEPRLIRLGDEKNIDAGINVTAVIGYYNEIRYFIDCLNNNTKPEVITPQNTIDCLDMVLKETQSSKTGKTIFLK